MTNSLDLAKAVISAEIESLHMLLHNLDEIFDSAVTLLSSTKGRVVITGVGKSGIIGRKISATLSSVGIPSYYISPLDALHGDLGSVDVNDTVIMISNSGRSRELLELLPNIKRRGLAIIALTGNLTSPLAQNANITLSTHVDKEACPHGIVPTSSTTAALVMGDALAICCSQKIGFSMASFLDNHPQGALGEDIERNLRCNIKIAS